MIATISMTAAGTTSINVLFINAEENKGGDLAALLLSALSRCPFVTKYSPRIHLLAIAERGGCIHQDLLLSIPFPFPMA